MKIGSLLVALVVPQLAMAGLLVVESVDPAVRPYVVVDGGGVGAAPVEVADLEAGTHVVGFRSGAFSAEVFAESVEIPETGRVLIRVDLEARSATVVADLATSTPADEPEADEQASQVGDLFVHIDGSARIWLDGADTGIDAPGMVREIGAGVHELQLRTPCSRSDAEVMVQSGRITRVDDVLLRDGPALLDVTSQPEGAVIRLDGTEVGTTPLIGHEATCGEHEIELRAPGHLSQATRVQALAFETTGLSVILQPETFGSLVLDLRPVTAVAVLDGLSLEPGPQTVEPIAAGEHELVIAGDGFQSVTQLVQVQADAVTRLQIELQPLGSQAVRKPRAPVRRILLNVAVVGAGAAAGAYAVSEFAAARSAYTRYLSEPDDSSAAAIFTSDVAPHKTRALIGGGVSAAVLAGGAGLWISTDFGRSATGQED